MSNCVGPLFQNDLDQLESLTEKWRDISQQVVEELLERSRASYSCSHTDQGLTSVTIAQVLDHLHIDYQLIRYSPDDQSFF